MRPVRFAVVLLGLFALPAAAADVFAQAAPSAATTTTSTPSSEDSGKAYAPAWLPRGAFVGSFYNEGTLTPQVRVQWQATVVQMRNDALVAYFEGGGGYALTTPENLRPYGLGGMTYFYQHFAMAGLGYNAVYRDGWTWGFQVLTGAHFYGARFELYDRANAMGGTVEGRGNIGIPVGPVRLNLSAGWAQLWVVPRIGTGVGSGAIAAQFTGGPVVGIYIDWRPVVYAGPGARSRSR